MDGRGDGWYADYAGMNVVDEIRDALEYTKDCRDYKDLREAFDPHYVYSRIEANVNFFPSGGVRFVQKAELICALALSKHLSGPFGGLDIRSWLC